MSKKFLWLIAIFMACAMLGLILVQAYWINNAFQLKEKQFSQAVDRALYDISNDLQETEAMNSIMDQLSGYDMDTSYIDPFGYFNYQYQGIHSRSELHLGFGSGLQPEKIFQSNVHIFGQTDPRDGSQKITIISGDTILPAGSNTGIDPDSSLMDGIDLSYPDPFRSSFERRMAQNRAVYDRIMQRMMASAYPVETRIDQATLNQVIERNLHRLGIDINYEYAVVRQNGEIAYQSDNFQQDQEAEIFNTSLFPPDFFPSSNYLLMYFPRRTSFLLKSLGFMGISSMLLTVFIIFSFTLTMYIIFRQKKLSEIKNDFVSNMTHELKTPISTISLASQMLNDHSIPDQSKNLGNISRIITDETKRLGYQVEKVLQMAIFDRGRIRLKKKRIDINELVHQVITSFGLQISNRNGQVTESYQALNATVEVDPVHFTNIISNLVDNAIKYSGDDPHVGITTFNRNGKLCIRVRDNGMGIKKEDQKRIFEKFYRVPTGNVHNVKGFGLGLSYVKKIVEEHQGTVSLRSEVNKGTEFEISIPVTVSKS